MGVCLSLSRGNRGASAGSIPVRVVMTSSRSPVSSNLLCVSIAFAWFSPIFFPWLSLFCCLFFNQRNRNISSPFPVCIQSREVSRPAWASACFSCSSTICHLQSQAWMGARSQHPHIRPWLVLAAQTFQSSSVGQADGNLARLGTSVTTAICIQGGFGGSAVVCRLWGVRLRTGKKDL